MKQFKDGGLDLFSTSIGFSASVGKVPWAPAFLVPFASRIRSETGIAVGSAWLLDAPADAEKAIAENEVDVVMMGACHAGKSALPISARDCAWRREASLGASSALCTLAHALPVQ